jgi:hypothetical protein
MMFIVVGFAVAVFTCVTIKRIENNTAQLEQHTRELLEKAQKFDELYNRLSAAIGAA